MCASRPGGRPDSLVPACPAAEREAIAEHACAIRSGRVGRSAAAKRLDETALELAVRAQARAEIGAEVEEILDGWRGGTGE